MKGKSLQQHVSFRMKSLLVEILTLTNSQGPHPINSQFSDWHKKYDKFQHIFPKE
jgi:hypothetical protein